jgi:protein-tyrosine phosphatase
VNPEIYWIKTRGKGRLAVMPRPRGGDWLDDEIRGLKTLGIDILVSMLTDEEEEFLDLRQEGAAALRHGLQFFSHPIPDRNVPDSPREIWSLARSLAAEFAAGRKIAVHCRMGIGRSPLLLACILVSGGMRTEDAWIAIGDARGCVVPDTLEQRAWLSRTAPASPLA